MRRTLTLVVLDGWGIGSNDQNSNPLIASPPQNLNYFRNNYRSGALQASGIAVGLPWGEEGNSEVGHMTMGAGKIIYQHYPRISIAIRNKTFFKNEALSAAFDAAKKKNVAVNCIGLLTSGNVHASLEHVEALIHFAKESGVTRLNLHPITDGKDSPRRSAGALVKKLQDICAREGVGTIGSIGGRYYGLDRDGHLDRTTLAHDAMTGKAKIMPNIETWINDCYTNKLEDEFIEPVTVDANHAANDGDVIIFWDFREDSVRQIAESFISLSTYTVTTFTSYAPKFNVPVAFPAEIIARPLGAVLSANNKIQLRIAETEKYAHVTYFFNGLHNEVFKNEYRILIPSQNVAHHDEHPEMRAKELGDRVIQAIEEGGTDFILVNFANGDMIAHTGNFAAALTAIQSVDIAVRRIYDASIANNGIMMVTSDHGNVEQMRDPLTGVAETQHNKSAVPCYLIAKEFVSIKKPDIVTATEQENAGMLADLAPTILELMEIPAPQEMTGVSLTRTLR